MTNQLTAEDVSRMYAAKDYAGIEQARLDGRLSVLMGGQAPIDPAAQLSEADVKRLYAERRFDEIAQARQDGRLDQLLNPEGA